MVDEMRAMRLELDNRRHFTPEKQTIEMAREQLTAWTEPAVAEDPEVVVAKSAMNFRKAADHDLFEVG